MAIHQIVVVVVDISIKSKGIGIHSLGTMKVSTKFRVNLHVELFIQYTQ